jgi:hypothetical protein
VADDRGRREPPVEPDPAEGIRPSPRARERFATDLRLEVEGTQAAWYDATLRGRERLLAGDDHGAMEAIEDQRRLLRLLERRLERVVASAAVEREAEGVLADSGSSAVPDPSAQGDAVTPPLPVGADEHRDGSGGRLRALVAAGAAAAVTALAVGLGALVGPVATPAPEVAGPVEGTAESLDAHGADAAGAQDVGTAEQAPPQPVDPYTAAPWPRDWRELWSAEAGAGDAAPAEAGQREQRETDDTEPRGDTTATSDAPSTDSEDHTSQDDAAREEGDRAPDADERDEPQEDELLDLRRLIQPEDDVGEDEEDPRDDEELPGADADATASPDDAPGDGDDDGEDSAEVPTRLDDAR